MRVTTNNVCLKMEWKAGRAISADSAFIEVPEEELVLLQAVRYGDIDMITRMLNHDADINAKHSGEPMFLKLPYLFRQIRLTGYSCLHVAVFHSDIKLIETLLDFGGDLNIEDGNSRTPLFLATAVGRLDVVDLLLTRGSNPDIQTASKRTAIMEAVCRQDLPVVQRLIESGADLNLTDIKGGSLLYFACIVKSPNLEIIRHILEAGVDVNKANSKGATVLMMVVRNIDIDVMKLLVDAGADINMKDHDGRTAFHLAIENMGSKRATATIDFLLSNGADADSQDKKGLTPLQKAVKFGKLRAIERLLNADCERSYDMLQAWRIVQLCSTLPKFQDWLNEEFYNPRSLLRLSRGAVRKTLAHNIGRIVVGDLEVPQFLKDFLLVKYYTEIEL